LECICVGGRGGGGGEGESERAREKERKELKRARERKRERERESSRPENGYIYIYRSMKFKQNCHHIIDQLRTLTIKSNVRLSGGGCIRELMLLSAVAEKKKKKREREKEQKRERKERLYSVAEFAVWTITQTFKIFSNLFLRWLTRPRDVGALPANSFPGVFEPVKNLEKIVILEKIVTRTE
jgi:hypothetical protein